jgi:hypothetical protein
VSTFSAANCGIPPPGADEHSAPNILSEMSDAVRSPFLESLMDTDLYSIGAYFCDEHPELVDEVVERSDVIERRGLEAYAKDSGTSVEESFETLLTGLAVRYYNAAAG